ncbi:flagellin Hag [Oceanobacillus sp. CFH 90083]|uniref:flagellin Hag n=1 Tax=Oceanobacillus sp. CFH 90083 TaxID=2592336 RepID=UPI00128D05EE|nr:flagellin Hag [Oceanobacillus sp. CFH 90083]
MIINHNISAINAHRQLGVNQNGVQSSLEKLSSGLRINRAGDDAAGLAISEKMRGQIRGLEMATKNSQDGISLIQTAEGALTETHSILQRVRELTVQAGNLGTQEQDDLQAIQDEISNLLEEIDGISERTAFNGKTLLNGDLAEGEADLVFQIGANENQALVLNINDMSAEALEIDGLDVSEFTESSDFDEAVGLIDAAIKTVSAERSKLGAVQNRLEHTINNLGASAENLTAAESRIRDVDYDSAA